MLVRFARRLANWEEPLPIAELQKREFKAWNGGPDLRPSVYALEPAQPEIEIVRPQTEPAAGIDPPNAAMSSSVSEGSSARATLEPSQRGALPEIVQAYAEHAAAAGMDPPPTAHGLNASQQGRTILETIGSPRFAFIRERHREISLADLNELHDFIGKMLASVIENRHPVTRAEVYAYVRGKLRDGDAEWHGAADDGAKSWLVKLRDQADALAKAEQKSSDR